MMFFLLHLTQRNFRGSEDEVGFLTFFQWRKPRHTKPIKSGSKVGFDECVRLCVSAWVRACVYEIENVSKREWEIGKPTKCLFLRGYSYCLDEWTLMCDKKGLKWYFAKCFYEKLFLRQNVIWLNLCKNDFATQIKISMFYRCIDDLWDITAKIFYGNKT